jgi:type VI protein secretion system component Hcp
MRTRIFAASLALAVVASTLLAQPPVTMTVDGVDGTLSVDSVKPNPSPGMKAGTLRVARAHDSHSPSLMLACATGRPIRSVVLRGISTAPYMQWTLKNVRITSYSLSHTGGRAMEQIVMNYSKVTFDPSGVGQ